MTPNSDASERLRRRGCFFLLCLREGAADDPGAREARKQKPPRRDRRRHRKYGWLRELATAVGYLIRDACYQPISTDNSKPCLSITITLSNPIRPAFQGGISQFFSVGGSVAQIGV